MAAYRRNAKHTAEQRRAAALKAEKEKEAEDTSEEEAEAEKNSQSVDYLLKRDAENRVLAEQERLRQVRMAEIEAQAMRPGSNRGGGSAAGMADATSARSMVKMEKLFGLIARALGVDVETDAMEMAESIAELVVGGAEEGSSLSSKRACLSGGVSSVASAQLEANSLEKEESLALKKRQLEGLKAQMEARLTGKAHEMSGGGLGSVKDVVDLEDKIESSIVHTEMAIDRVANSTKVGKSAALGRAVHGGAS